MNRTALLCFVILALSVVLVSSEDGGPGDGNNDGRNRGKLTLNGMHWIERMKRNADMKDDMKKRSVDQQKIHI